MLKPASIDFEHVVRQRVRILAGARRCARPIVAAPSIPTQRTCNAAAGFNPAANSPRSMQARDVRFGARRGLLEELEPLEVLAEARHRAVDEHQLEVLGMRLGELVERPQPAAQPLAADR